MTPDVLRQYAMAMPAGTVIPVIRETLLDLLDGQIVPPAPVTLPPDCDPWLTVPMAAKYVGRSPSCVSTWCWSGKVNAVKLNGGRRWSIRRSELDRFANNASDVGERHR